MTPCSWRFYGHGSGFYNSFIKTVVNIMKPESTKMPWKLSLSKNTIPEEHCTKIENISLVIIGLFFSQINLVFIDILDSFCSCLFTFLPFDFWQVFQDENLYYLSYYFIKQHYSAILHLIISNSEVIQRQLVFNCVFAVNTLFGLGPQCV